MLLHVPWKQFDGHRVMKVKDGVGTGVVVGGSADVVSTCELDSDSLRCVCESESEAETSGVPDHENEAVGRERVSLGLPVSEPV